MSPLSINYFVCVHLILRDEWPDDETLSVVMVDEMWLLMWFNPLKCSGVGQLHLKVFNAIQV